MKILIINSFYYPNMVGGTEQVVKKLAEGLFKNGHEVMIYTCGAGNKPVIENINGVKVNRLSSEFSPLLFKKMNGIKKKIYKITELRNYTITKELDSVLKKFKPDIVHTNNIYYISPYVWKYISNHKINIIHTVHDYWLLCPRTTLRKKSGVNCNNVNLACSLYRKYFATCCKYITYVTFPSKFVMNIFQDEKFFSNSKSICISNGIDYDVNGLFEIIDRRLERNSDIIKFMFIGNLFESKGIKWLIECFKSINNENIQLIVCGDGNLAQFVKNASLEDNRIRYMGRVDGDVKQQVFEEADVLIVPSIWYEPFGMVILEAYKYGMPVIGNNIGGISEVIENNMTGKLVKPLDKDEFSNAVKYFSNRLNIKSMLKNISPQIEKFSLENQIKSFEKIYNKCLKDKE